MEMGMGKMGHGKWKMEGGNAAELGVVGVGGC
jgi:hypothetical protein